jgi:hypothetical protein
LVVVVPRNCAGNELLAYRLIRCKISEIGLRSSADAAAAAQPSGRTSQAPFGFGGVRTVLSSSVGTLATSSDVAGDGAPKQPKRCKSPAPNGACRSSGSTRSPGFGPPPKACPFRGLLGYPTET